MLGFLSKHSLERSAGEHEEYLNSWLQSLEIPSSNLVSQAADVQLDALNHCAAQHGVRGCRLPYARSVQAKVSDTCCTRRPANAETARPTIMGCRFVIAKEVGFWLNPKPYIYPKPKALNLNPHPQTAPAQPPPPPPSPRTQGLRGSKGSYMVP